MNVSSLAKIVESTITEPIMPPHLRMNSESDPRRVNIPNFVVIYGKPGSGKTTLCRELTKTIGYTYLAADSVFSSHMAPSLANWENFLVYRDQPNEHFSVSHYVDSSSYDHDLFINYLKEELRRKLQQSPKAHIVLLDGYVFKNHVRVFKDLVLPPERTLVLHASMANYRYMVEGIDVTGHRYTGILQFIRESFLAKCANTVLPKSRYQSFKSLGLAEFNSDNSDSDTQAKYAASHLDEVVHASDRVADIGCNAGYFCFRVANKTNGSIIGVDLARNWVEIASQINNSIFLRNNITFFRVEALEFLVENPDSFEIIHCASTYHYFREQQIGFLRAAHRALTPKGFLILEVELANTGSEPEIVKKSRGVDSTPCAFPNRSMFLQQISGLFEIDSEFTSVFQKGSFYNRIYFHLRPIQPGVKFVLDKAQGNRISGWAMYPKSPHQKVRL
ncbi:MAG TPA: methyltransferase domain-containing protein, partial [Candidatus Babeliaceae bacterium]|nr:methyltransferase domain-containing protein [Candidatus Babeliaceae bacterium]